MKNSYSPSLKAAWCFALVALAAVSVPVFIGGCTTSSRDTVPITSSSTRAVEYFTIARDLAEKLRHLEARHYYREALALDSTFALAYLYMADTEPLEQDRSHHINMAVSLIGNVTEGEKLLILAGMGKQSGSHQKLGDYLRQLAALYPQDARVHNDLGNYHFHDREFGQAVAEYIKAVKLDPQFAPTYNGLGYAYSYLGEIEDAEKAFLKYIALIPNDPNPYDSYAELMLRTGRFAESLEYYQKALKKNPYFLNAYESMASAYNYLGQHGEARTHLATMLERARDFDQYQRAYYALAVSFADEGLIDSALTMLRTSQQLAEEVRDVMSMAAAAMALGDAYREYGQYDQALAEYSSARRFVEQSGLDESLKEMARHSFFYNAAKVETQRGNLAAARTYAAEFQTHISDEGAPLQLKRVHELAGLIALADRDYQTAIDHLQQADPRDPCILRHIASAYRKLNNPEMAAVLDDRFGKFYADNNLSYSLVRGRETTTLAAGKID